MFAAIWATQRVWRRPFRRAGRTAYVLALCCMFWACESGAPSRTLESIEPSSILNNTATVVTLKGSGFLQIPKVSISSRSRAGVTAAYELRVGNVFTTDVVNKRSATELQFALEPGIPVGVYDVVLRPQAGADLTLRRALTVAAPDESGFHLSLEDTAGGTGRALPDIVNKKVGGQLTCYAVVRDADGAFVRDAAVSWKATGAISKIVDGASSLSLSFPGTGDTTIQALSPAFDPVSVRVHVAGPAEQLLIEPSTLTLAAGDRSRTFTVRGVDADGLDTVDVGDLTYAVVDGALPDLDMETLTLTPRKVSVGHIQVKSSYGLSVTSGIIEVTKGPLAKLTISPSNLHLSADDSPVQFTVKGSDAFDNEVTDLGTLTWSVVESSGVGPIGTVSDTGLFDPTTVGTGKVNVTNSSNIGVDSTVEVVAGKLVGLSIQPQTWIGLVGDPAQQFSVTGADADGNAINADVGTLTFSIGSGDIAAIDAQTGLFTPTSPGQGTIAVSSSLGYTTSTQNVVVSPKGATLRITAVHAPSFLWAGEAGARVDVVIASTDPGEVAVSGLSLKFNDLFGDQSSAFTVYADRDNVEHIAAGATQTLIYYVDVDKSLSSLTSLTITATGEAFPQFKAPFVFAGSVTTSSRIALSGPSLALTAPVPPANRICAGGRVKFGADTSNLLAASFEWSLPGATLASGSSLTDKAPSADYAAVGTYQNSVTATYFTYPTLMFGPPIFVGATASAAADMYPTGPVVFTAPAAGQTVDLSSFPRSNLITLSSALPLRQCDGSALNATGHRALTLFSDRGLVSASADIDPASPGIQVQLTTDGVFDSVPLIAPKNKSEGTSTLYAEYVEPNTGVITAAGDTTFKLSSDTQAPSVSWTIPSVDCASACLAPGDPLLFQFSEPLATASLSNVKVELLSGTDCSGAVSSNVTSNADKSYETSGDLLYVKPAARSGSYAVRVTLPTSVTDAASAHNALPATTRCVMFGALASPADPATPQLTAAAAATISPDGDGNTDTLTLKVSADAATSFLRLRVTRLGRTVWARLSPVTQAGEYTFVWDGADETGRIQSEGVYGYSVEAVNRAGKASAALRGFVELDSAVRMLTIRRPQ